MNDLRKYLTLAFAAFPFALIGCETPARLPLRLRRSPDSTPQRFRTRRFRESWRLQAPCTRGSQPSSPLKSWGE